MMLLFIFNNAFARATDHQVHDYFLKHHQKDDEVPSLLKEWNVKYLSSI